MIVTASFAEQVANHIGVPAREPFDGERHAAVGAEGFIGKVVHHHPILLVHYHHGGGNIIQHRLHQGHMVAQPLLQGIADADIPLHRQIMLQFPLRTEHRSDVNLHQVQAAVPPLVNQLAAPRLTLEQGMPHLLIDLARRLAAGQLSAGNR